jgi:hypothetical protein
VASIVIEKSVIELGYGRATEKTSDSGEHRRETIGFAKN